MSRVEGHANRSQSWAVTFSVAIVTHNRAHAVIRAIESAVDQHRDDCEIVVVDNDSRDGTSELIAQRFPSVRLVRLPRNVGCPDGRNHAYANCRGEFIVNLDDDGWLSDNALNLVEAVFRQDEQIGIVSMRQVYPEQEDDATPASIALKDVGLFAGGTSVFRHSMLQRIGGYPPDFFLFAEETYLSILALDAGYRIVNAPAIVMWHPKVGGSHVNTKHDYQLFRNNLLVTLRLYPGSLLFQYFPVRVVLYSLVAIRRRSFEKYLMALLNVIASVPATLLKRRPARRETVQRHLALTKS